MTRVGTILPTKAYRLVLEREIDRRTPEAGLWAEHRDFTPENRETVARNVLESQKVYEYPSRGLRDDLRELIALRIAPWLR